MLPKIFLTALFASTYVAALAVPPAEGDSLVVRAEAEPVEAIIEARAEVDAIEVGEELDADKAKPKKGGKGKKGKGAKGKGKGKKGKGAKGKGKGSRKGKGGSRKGKGGSRKGKGGSRKGKAGRKGGDRDADEA